VGAYFHLSRKKLLFPDGRVFKMVLGLAGVAFVALD
jgi:hypothetical protein